MKQLQKIDTPALENELAQIEEEARQDRAQHANRDWHAEAEQAGVDSDEVLAERTLYNARARRRDARLTALNDELKRRAAANVEGNLDTLRQQHAAAWQAASDALEGVDFAALDTLEAQIDRYLAAAGEVRSAAVSAASLAREHSAPAPGLVAAKAEQVEGLYDRLRHLAERVGTPGKQSRQDLSAHDIHRVELAQEA